MRLTFGFCEGYRPRRPRLDGPQCQQSAVPRPTLAMPRGPASGPCRVRPETKALARLPVVAKPAAPAPLPDRSKPGSEDLTGARRVCTGTAPLRLDGARQRFRPQAPARRWAPARLVPGKSGHAANATRWRRQAAVGRRAWLPPPGFGGGASSRDSRRPPSASTRE